MSASSLPARLWVPVPGQGELHLFPDQWFECVRCGHEVSIDSTPTPGDLCWMCAEAGESP